MEAKPPAMLPPEDLNDTDERILELLEEGRVTPQFVADQLDISRTYASEKLKRLVEHNHVNKLASGLYEITENGQTLLREVRAERKPWDTLDPVTDADLEEFPETTTEFEGPIDAKWLLLGVAEGGPAYYFEDSEAVVCEVSSGDPSTEPVQKWALNNFPDETCAGRMMAYYRQARTNPPWDRWSKFTRGLELANTFRDISPYFLTPEEKIGFAFFAGYEIEFVDTMSFIGRDSATTNEFTTSALRKMENCVELREWLDEAGLPRSLHERAFVERLDDGDS